jgi:drug/metabolite transporter (DMT)-like permease
MPVLLLILACVLWAVSFPLVKALHLEQSGRLPDVSSMFLASWMQAARFGLGALLLLPYIVFKQRPSNNEIHQGLQIALWGGLAMGFQADALAYTEASTSAFLTQAYCILLPLWACIRTRKKPTTRVVIATLMVTIGGAILAGWRPDHMKLGRGEMETLLAAFLFTFQILTFENPRFAENRGTSVTFVMFAGIAILFIPITLIFAPDPGACLAAGASIQSFVLIAVLAVFCSVGAYLLMNTWQRCISATEAGLIYTSEPVFAALLVLFLPAMLGAFIGQPYANESFSNLMIFGGFLILGANLLMQLKHPAVPNHLDFQEPIPDAEADDIG